MYICMLHTSCLLNCRTCQDLVEFLYFRIKREVCEKDWNIDVITQEGQDPVPSLSPGQRFRALGFCLFFD